MALGSWISTYETDTTNSTTVDQTDDLINSTRVFVRERGKVEHDFGDTSFEAGYTDTGRHAPGSARAFFQATSPTALRRPNNSANQSGATSTLTGSKDQGRLWVDSDNGELWYYNASGAWLRTNAVGSSSGLTITSTSSDTANLVNGSTTTLGSWSTALSIAAPALPGPAFYRLRLELSIPLRVTSGNDRYVRLDLNRVDPTPIVSIQTKELVLRQQVSGTFRGVTWIDFSYVASATAGTTYSYEVLGEVNTGTDVLWGRGAATLTSGGAINISPTAYLWLEPITV